MGTEEHVGPSTGINAEERGPCRSAGNPGRLTGSGSSREKMDRPDRWGGGGGGPGNQGLHEPVRDEHWGFTAMGAGTLDALSTARC